MASNGHKVKEPRLRFPKTATATIMLKDGEIYVETDDGKLDAVRVAAGGDLVFRTPEDSPIQWWSILWKRETPFEDRHGWASEARGRKKSQRISRKANGGGKEERSYEYAVVVSDGKDVYFRDPEVIVGPEDPG